MTSRRNFMTTLAGIALVAGRSGAARSQQIVTGTNTGATIVRLAVPEFVAASGEAELTALTQRFSETLWNDLDFSGVAELVSRSFYPLGSFGQPMDVLGNPVDASGNSYDRYGNYINEREYFMSNGEIVEDLQRESEYTRILAEKIIERYHKDNIVLTSHLVAFAAFEVLKRQNIKLDLYGILRLPADDYVFPLEVLEEVVGQLRQELIVMEQQGEIKLSEQIHWPLDKLIRDGISRLGSYHAAMPLRFNRHGEIVSDSFTVLYYYHNRMENYGLDKKIKWRKFELEVV